MKELRGHTRIVTEWENVSLVAPQRHCGAHDSSCAVSRHGGSSLSDKEAVHGDVAHHNLACGLVRTAHNPKTTQTDSQLRALMGSDGRGGGCAAVVRWYGADLTTSS
jgi:hypothetical protein